MTRRVIPWWWSFGLFVIVSWLLWRALGIRQGADTAFYLAGGRALLDGKLPAGVTIGWAYVGYWWFIALHQALGLGLGAIVLTQWLLSGGALLALYDLGRRLAGPTAGAIAAALAALNVDVARFTFYVLSDALFTSLLVLALYATYRALTTATRAWRIGAAALCVAMATVRLNGWVMLPALLTALVWSSTTTRRWLTLLIVGVMYLGVLAAGVARTGAAGVGVGLLWSGRVIWTDDASAITMPAPPPRPPDRNGWRAAIVPYVVRHPVACAQLAARRILTELVHVRRVYSARHNAMIWLTLPPLYVLAATGWWRHRRERFARLCAAVVGAQLLLVGVTAADWDGRYLLMVLPVITLWSAVGIAQLIRSA